MKGSSERNSASTRDRILDAAELLFAERGYAAVSMREIAAMASVRLSLLTYHLGSKDALYHAVFARRAGELAQARCAALDSALADASPKIRDLIAAFVGPSVKQRFAQGVRGAAFALLTAREAVDPREAERGLLAEHFDPTAGRFIDAFARVHPLATPESRVDAYLFCVGTLIVSMVSGERFKRLTGGTTARASASPSDVDALIKRLVDYCTGGVEKIMTDTMVTERKLKP